uniref:Rieske domain-containing protein n=1 Tax=Gopherus evgoodei TaxID=1825980 RepID=A0A8C4W4X8_9SAUR
MAAFSSSCPGWPDSDPAAPWWPHSPGAPSWLVLVSCRLREVEVAGHKVLLVRSKMEFSAVGSKCTHAGASLSKGVLAGNRLRCPWHGACFSIRTGDIEEYPTLDCLPCFKVTLPLLLSILHPSLFCLERCRSNENTIMGETRVSLTGAAALVCAETLRQEGFTGRIVMVTKEKHVPYDRTQLSKVCAWPDHAVVRSSEPNTACCPSLLQVVSVDMQGQKAHFQDGAFQRYDQLLIATGSSPRQLQCPGSDLENVCSLQTPEDANRILHLATGKRVVILGASFIGMEVAAFLSDKSSAICVVEREEFPFQAVLGPQVGGVAMKVQCCAESSFIHSTVRFHMPVTHFNVFRRSLSRKAVLASGEKLPADVVVFMQTNVPRVFAAGDVTSFPVTLFGETTATIRHWQIAQAHGHIAALNMLKKQKALHTVPFFWTSLLGKSIRYAGYGKGYTETVVKGSLEQLKFLVFYIKDDYVIAVASLNFDPMVSLVAEVMYSGRQISKAEAQSSDTTWMKQA